MNSIFTKVLRKANRPLLAEMQRKHMDVLMLLGQLHAERVRNLQKIGHLWEAEFKVFSQFGEDGVIQYLIHKIEIPNKVFIEFGVENYKESNTRFLLLNNNWSGLVIDAGKSNVRDIIKDPIYWKHDLTAKCAFVTRENINDLIASNIGTGDIGVLSIDIDGNDYWVWDSISVVSPRIVVCEYNSVFGHERAVTIPYREDFVRSKAHYSHLYCGASLPALCQLADKKGYDCVGTTSAGNDAFFVRKDVPSPLRKYVPKEAYVEAKFRESRDRDGQLTCLAGKDRLKEIAEMPVWDTEANRMILIKDMIENCS
ncbi:MAG: hypothetical protein ACYS1A_17255 [Planctomycetota bacterium]